MHLPKLTPEQILVLCPNFENIVEVGIGGFKTVYKATIEGSPEVIKVIGIPRADGSEDQDRFREECLGRIQREVDILGRCATPFLVKLASLPLAGHVINGDFYAVYSEELLDGPDLWKLIRAKASKPDESEVKLLMKCLLLSIKELWSMRYIHRDIKPANVIKLADPGSPIRAD